MTAPKKHHGRIVAWLIAYRPRPIIWLRTHLFGPRLVTFSDRWPVIVIVVLALTIAGVALQRINAADVARTQRGCKSYASDITSARADLALYSVVARLQLDPDQRMAITAAIAGKQDAIASKKDLRRGLGCP